MLANLAYRHADYVVALEAFEELLTLQRSAGDRLGAAYTLAHLANVHFLGPRTRRHGRVSTRVAPKPKTLVDRHFENFWRNHGSMVALCEGRYELARTLAAAASAAFEADNNPVSCADCQKTLGTVEREEGHYGEANARFLEALKVAVDFGDRTLLAHLLEGFSGVASALGQHQRAVRLGGAAAMRESAGAPLSPAWQALAERWRAISRQALGEEAVSAAWAAGRSLPIERALQEAREG
jgi:tetratricopeptide (TPR) repeat protein